MPFSEIGIDGGELNVVGDFLLARMRQAGVRNVYVVLREGKWDIPAYWGNGAKVGLNIAYPLMRYPFGVPYTVAEACKFVGDADVAMGFPDIVFTPPDAIVKAVERRRSTGADVVLALAKTPEPQFSDTVAVDANGGVTRIHVKQRNDLRQAWVTATWSSRFTRYLTSLLERAATDVAPDEEVQFGTVLNAAIAEGFSVSAVSFPDSAFADVGHPKGQALARSMFQNG